jgi:hypothetical protein
MYLAPQDIFTVGSSVLFYGFGFAPMVYASFRKGRPRERVVYLMLSLLMFSVSTIFLYPLVSGPQDPYPTPEYFGEYYYHFDQPIFYIFAFCSLICIAWYLTQEYLRVKRAAAYLRRKSAMANDAPAPNPVES